MNVNKTIAGLLVAASVAAPLSAQVPDGEPTVTEVADGLYMIAWRGGNIGVSIGEDGVVLVDDQYAPMAPRNLEALRTVTDKPLRFVLNTHWHGDHTGGNEAMAGEGALIIAHDNVRKRLAEGMLLREVPPATGASLPVVTFDSAVTLHFNGGTVHAFHVDPAHTDGDSVVHFRDADVIHAGDLYFNGIYPFIDGQSGGSVQGVIDAVDRILEMCGPTTRIIPGHGPLADCEDLEGYREMLAVVHERIAKAIAGGASADDVVADAPTREYDAEWGDGFMKPDRWVRSLYETMSQEKQGHRH